MGIIYSHNPIAYLQGVSLGYRTEKIYFVGESSEPNECVKHRPSEARITFGFVQHTTDKQMVPLEATLTVSSVLISAVPS